MTTTIDIKTALISVFNKEGILDIVRELVNLNIKIYSTGGTLDYINANGFEAHSIESVTQYPSILGGRVKTLHPKVFGGILHRRNATDKKDVEQYDIPTIDLIICDLYPFKETLTIPEVTAAEIIEKIDIGGVSLIRAGAKNFNHTVVISQKTQYSQLSKHLSSKGTSFSLSQRKELASVAFQTTLSYDAQIFSWMAQKPIDSFTDLLGKEYLPLRYGENPHQEAAFIGNFSETFTQLNGKQVSYNNILDIDSAVGLIGEFDSKLAVVAIIKHNNTCCFSQQPKLLDAWNLAMQGDSKSAFGGIIIINQEVTLDLAKEINQIFFEILIAPSYNAQALKLLKEKKNRILLRTNQLLDLNKSVRSACNGLLFQDRDNKMNVTADKVATTKKPTEKELNDLELANKLVKHLKSNGIVLVKDATLIGFGSGHTSRIDALNQAVKKANEFGFNLKGSVMASDAFFPFSDCVEIAVKEGIKAIVQPGGSIRDKDSINACEEANISMLLTGFRHFKH